MSLPGEGKKKIYMAGGHLPQQRKTDFAKA